MTPRQTRRLMAVAADTTGPKHALQVMFVHAGGALAALLLLLATVDRLGRRHMLVGTCAVAGSIWCVLTVLAALGYQEHTNSSIIPLAAGRALVTTLTFVNFMGLSMGHPALPLHRVSLPGSAHNSSSHRWSAFMPSPSNSQA